MAHTLTEFTCFSALPTEIRLQIWRIAHTAFLPVDPRIFEIDEYDELDRNEPPIIGICKHTYPIRIPYLPGINRESHFEGIAYAKLCGYKLVEFSNVSVWINLKIDTITLTFDRIYHSAYHSDQSCIKCRSCKFTRGNRFSTTLFRLSTFFSYNPSILYCENSVWSTPGLNWSQVSMH